MARYLDTRSNEAIVTTFMVSQRVEAIQWSNRSSDSFEGETNKKKEANEKRNDEGEATNGETLVGGDAISHVEATKDADFFGTSRVGLRLRVTLKEYTILRASTRRWTPELVSCSI
ncbi:hypothetical protein PVK06_024394 [Gossypium arboreum]|uniref:Uncharacterized protein n=1 Tax=Gossypium arboreum TaxID=29729 RepID=A0ABR0PDL5_GOSAR|nr:hypothetical protein PVK06_024394 [Gossypium arboreum]